MTWKLCLDHQRWEREYRHNQETWRFVSHLKLLLFSQTFLVLKDAASVGNTTKSYNSFRVSERKLSWRLLTIHELSCCCEKMEEGSDLRWVGEEARIESTQALILSPSLMISRFLRSFFLGNEIIDLVASDTRFWLADILCDFSTTKLTETSSV